LLFTCPGALKTRTWTFSSQAMKAHCFELLKHKIRGNNLESLGGSGRRFGGANDEDAEGKIDIEDDMVNHPMKWPISLKSACILKQTFSRELDQIDELNNLAGSDLGDAFGFTGANGRAVLSQLKKRNCGQRPKALQRQFAGCKAAPDGQKPGGKWRRRSRQSHWRQSSRVGRKRRHLGRQCWPVGHRVSRAPSPQLVQRLFGRR
jgi:hypothetical protein